MARRDQEEDEVKRKRRIDNSTLYSPVSNDKDPIIYSSAYNIAFLGLERLHPFDSSKWGRIKRFLVEDGLLDHKRVVEPVEATKEDLLVVHTEGYLESLKRSFTVAVITEVPPLAFLPNFILQQKVLRPFRKQVGGTVLSAKLAKDKGWAINLGGGFHHCCSNEGGGFCAYADITLTIQFAFSQLGISRVMIIDLDAHQGNGHEHDFMNNKSIYILDMYNSDIYPRARPSYPFLDMYENQIIQIQFSSYTTTEKYLDLLSQALEKAAQNFEPDLLIYNAGTDILDGDPLGRLLVSPDGVKQRDEMVFKFSREKNCPIVMLTSGGYMKTSARVIADSIGNLATKGLIHLPSS
ncbi:unnamed protein product [Sphagnum troendelagicum]|uniref:Histone deacetylase domain-containing protein n=1 Tax=Sphagnum troendelagicum TaxID=128251 RepID=A0ABP0TFV4_9BRYO